MLQFGLRLKIAFVSLLLFINACTTKNDFAPPVIEIKIGGNYTPDGKVVNVGTPVKMGIAANAGDAPITNFYIYLTSPNGVETALDSGIYNTSFNYDKVVSFGATNYEKWTFRVMDKNGKFASTSINIFKNSNSVFGPIRYIPSVKIGAQNCNLYGSFFSLLNDSLYYTSESNAVQDKIYLMAYWGSFLNPPLDFVISSPNESDAPGIFPNLINWTYPKNETRYKSDSTTISPAQFDAAYNDSIIITNYTSATIGKRKVKNPQIGWVVPFCITSGNLIGKRGLLKVVNIEPGANGYMELAIKMQ